MRKNAYRENQDKLFNPLENREKKYPNSSLATPIPVC
jgi:hypothetical protein